jgi:lyso-ornithine lipid O-acyltransferase
VFYYIGLFIRRVFLITDHVIFTSLLYLLSFLPSSILKRFYPRLFWAWSRSFVRALDVDLNLLQNNARPLPRQYLLIANHPSAFEDIGIPSLFNVHSLAKVEVRDWPIVGRISHAAGTLYVRREDRDSRREAYEDILQAVKEGKNVALYPEGGCKGRRIF